MQSKYSIPLSSVVSEFSLEEIYMPKDASEIKISSPEVSRPGLALSGFIDVFEPFRIQIIGKAEHKYLSGLSKSERVIRVNAFFKLKPVAVVLTTGLVVYEEMLDAAKEEGIPLLRTDDRTSPFMASLIASLNTSLAPRITRHGVLVEVYGEGVLILGDSGIGKSETAIELVKRGHRLIADDAVEIKRVSSKTLVGTAPDLIRYYIELRGIGIVDVRRLFGMGAVKATERIDLVIKLENWAPDKTYDRFGLDEEVENILGIAIPAITIPVHHGRNLAVVLEIAAMNNRQKKMGYNTAEEFNQRLMEQIESEE
ncbi:MAG: HPr(Ser) kinase/phosphatase [Ruminococcaceae bacterium]|nr:HPr(Ser) kinase/phosphatase [Oscillospiraceae bacterium]